MRILNLVRVSQRTLMTNEVRRVLYSQCLNREFDKLLPKLRQISVADMDYSLLQLTLRQSCRWGNIECIDFIWYKYVKRHNSMLIEPSMLSSIGQIALGEDKSFIASELVSYYRGKYGKLWRTERPQKFIQWEYELLRIKVEMFAKTALNRSFSEKWKVFLQDIDHVLPSHCVYNYRDFPNLTKSYERGQGGKIAMIDYLFEDKDISVTNETTLPLLLNIILLQGELTPDTKLNLFKRFYTMHPSLPIIDTIEIMVHECDGYRICEVLDLVFLIRNNNNLTKLIPDHIKTRIEIKLKDSMLEYKLNQYFSLKR